MFAFGRTADNGGSLTATPGAGTTPHQASITGPGTGPAAQTAAAPVSLARQHVDPRRRDGQGRGRDRRPDSCALYEDGALMTSNDALTVKPA